MLWEASTSKSEHTAFDSMVTARDGLVTYLAGPGVVPPQIAENAYELLGRSYLQNRVIDWYRNNQSIADYMANYIGDALNMLGNITGVAWNLEIRFNDGSIAWFRQTIDRNYDGMIRLELSRILDVNGNEIPLDAVGFEGESFLFENDSAALESFLEAASRIGVRMVRVDAFMSHSSGTTTVIDLVCDTTGPKAICTPVGTPNNPK